MAVTSEGRLSDSPFIESIWQVQAESDGVDIVAADMSWDMIITRQDGKTNLTVWGPMTKAVPIPHTAGSEALARSQQQIVLAQQFSLGTADV
jgi:hypothetical protein